MLRSEQNGEMFLLDTDHMSALEWGSGAAGQRLIARLDAVLSLVSISGNGLFDVARASCAWVTGGTPVPLFSNQAISQGRIKFYFTIIEVKTYA